MKNEYTGIVNGEDVKYQIKLKTESKFIGFLSKLMFWQKDFLTNEYYITIGSTIFCPKLPPSKQLLEHELIHVYDFQKNPIWFIFSYIFILPTVFTMRSFWEKRAYSWNIRSHKLTSATFYKEQFCTSKYFFMWPFPGKVEKWIEDCTHGKYAPIYQVVLDKNKNE